MDNGKTVDPVIEEVLKLTEYEPLQEIDVKNAIEIRKKLIDCPQPIVEFTKFGLAFTWPRFEIVFEDGDILYFRYRTDRKFSWKPQEIGGGIEEGFFTDDLLDKVKNELRILSQTK